MMKKKNLFFALFVLFVLPYSVNAASISVIQSGADSGTVMLGKTFTVSVTGTTANAQATITLPTGFSLSGESSTKTTDNNGAVSWTTVIANQILSAQTISVSISGQGSPTTVTSSSFDVITSPSLSATVTPSSSVSVTQGQTFTLSLNIQNTGETTARFGTVTISPSDFSIYSGCSPSDILGGQSVGISCTILASLSATTGTRTLSILITPTNADSLTKQVSVTVNAATTTTTTTTITTTTTSGSVAPGTGTVTVTQTVDEIFPGVTKKITVSKVGLAFTGIDIQVSYKSTNVTIVVEKLDSRPSSVASDPPGVVYQYVKINKTNLNDIDINMTKIRFMVEKSWVQNNNIDLNSIKLNRYYNNVWETYSVNKTSDDNTYYYFEAETKGLSVFAITGEKVTVTTTTAVPAEVTTPTTEVATTTLAGTTTTAVKPTGLVNAIKKYWYLLIAALIILAAVYWFSRTAE